MLGYGSDVVNGQLVTLPVKQGYAPLTFGQAYTGPRFDGAGSVWNVPPVMSSMGAGLGVTEAGAMTGLQPMPTSASISQKGKVNYFSVTKSPLPMALIFLTVGLLMLHFIHYGK
jgi:hypothetical protein